jgi:hypothetical protein
LIHWIFPLVAFAAVAQAPRYSGPVPPSSDLPFLKHASNLLPAETVEVKEEKRKDDTVVFIIKGESSPSKTPLGLPVFLLKTEKLNPLKLQMYRLQTAEGHREISASGKKSADPIHVIVTRIADGLFRLEVGDSLDNGEYMLSLEGTTQAFCFAID